MIMILLSVFFSSGNCPTKYSCGSGLAQCYNPIDRCDGDAKCSNNADEENCSKIIYLSLIFAQP